MNMQTRAFAAECIAQLATVVRNNKTGASQAVVGALPPEAFTAVIDRVLDAKP